MSKYYKASTVKAVQKKLNKKGFDSGRPDGSYGSKTRNAIRQFQRKYNMAVNGKINKRLCKKLHIQV
ncbi:peptidoglycan-binding domain-containing protein [Jutongia sp.]|uniref:peptidoglycan-binding domain-containing protein n=1 Tax=Jutongia sp. TaxID=2944204 RepID=UPI003079CE8C